MKQNVGLPTRPTLQILMALLFFSLVSFCLYAVLSHYLLLRRMKKHTTAIISSVMDSEFTLYPRKKVAVRLMQPLWKKFGMLSRMRPILPVSPFPVQSLLRNLVHHITQHSFYGKHLGTLAKKNNLKVGSEITLFRWSLGLSKMAKNVSYL